MPKKTTLSDLKISLSDIMIAMSKSSNEDVDHAEAIKMLKQQNHQAIRELTPILLDMALKRLASESGRKKTRSANSVGGVDLFGVYSGIPNMMSTGKGRAKDFRKATLVEGKEWLADHSGAPSVDPKRNRGVEYMINDLAPYAVTGKETFEELTIIKAKAIAQSASNA